MVNTMRLTEVQDQARSALLRSRSGHIDVHVRQSMWATLGAGSEESRVAQGEITQAHRARATLMSDCLRLALPEWEADKRRAGGEILLDPRDEPTAALAYAAAYLDGGMSRADFMKHVNRLQDLSFYLSELHERFPNTELVAHAARSVLWVSAWDQASDYEPEYREEENEVFPADFMIAWLKSGSAPWHEEPAAAARRTAYWTWYIEVAFARSWAIAHGDE